MTTNQIAVFGAIIILVCFLIYIRWKKKKPTDQVTITGITEVDDREDVRREMDEIDRAIEEKYSSRPSDNIIANPPSEAQKLYNSVHSKMAQGMTVDQFRRSAISPYNENNMLYMQLKNLYEENRKVTVSDYEEAIEKS